MTHQNVIVRDICKLI